MLRSRLAGTGSYLPEKVLTNHDLERMVDTSDAWIFARTGIRERRISVDEPVSEMGAKAAKKALKAAGLHPRDVDLVVVGTVTPDMAFPSTACFVQSRLGVRPGAAAFDVSAACSGFLYALDAADKYIRSGSARNALVIGVDRFSKIIDWKDRSTCILFGDGAGAVVLKAEKGRHGILSTRIHSDGRQWEMLYAPNACPPSPFEAAEQVQPYLRMQGNETFRIAVRTMGSAIAGVMEDNGLKAEDIACLVPHQANLRIIEAIRHRLKLSPDKVVTNLEKYGNTSAASIPIALDEAVREGRIKANDIILFVAFGGGLTWASSVVRW